MRLRFLFLMFPLVACAPNVEKIGDESLMKPGRAQRQGEVLTLNVSEGKPVVFTNGPFCEVVETTPCDSFHLMGDFPVGHAYVVQQWHYEDSDFILIDDRTGRQTPLSGMPIFSPEGDQFLISPNSGFTAEHDLEIWRREGDGNVLEWTHNFSDGMVGLYEARVLRWDRNKIVLALSQNLEETMRATLTRDGVNWRVASEPAHGSISK